MDEIDPRLSNIDDCLYRVAIRALIIRDDKVLLVKEPDDGWWALPGGGVEYGETVQVAMAREVEEELGIPAHQVSSDSEIVYYNIGSVVNSIPRMNIYFNAIIPDELLNDDQSAHRQWFSREEFLAAPMNPSYDKTQLAQVIF